jgi:hypothetical protein
MTGAEAARLAAEGRLAAACVAVPMPEHERLTELADANAWIALMVRVGLTLHPEPKAKNK